MNETMIDVKRFDLDFFSTNPTIIDKGNRLRVITPRWRTCAGLFSGYRYLDVNPRNSEVVLYRHSAWFSKFVVRLTFNQIRNIKPSKFNYHKTIEWGFGGGAPGTPTPFARYTYIALWSTYLVLEDQADMLPLFQWKRKLGSVRGWSGAVAPFINYEVADESNQERDFNRLVSRLCELTGKPLSWD